MAAPQPVMDHLLVKKLTKAGFTEDQAEALASAVSGLASKADLEQLATKQDLEQLRAELRADMSDLRTELRTEMSELRTALRTEMSDLRMELRTEMSDLRTELRTDMAGLEARLAHTIRNSLIGGMVAMTTVFGGFVAIAQLYL
jgi:DNA anti-recombination protein RmuC